MNKSARQTETLEHAGRICTGLAIERFVQPEEIGEFADSLCDLGARKIVQTGEQAKIFAAGKPAVKAFLDTGVIPDLLARAKRVSRDVGPANFGATARGKEQSGEHAQEGGLPSAIFSDEGNCFSRINREGDPAECAQRLAGDGVQ